MCFWEERGICSEIRKACVCPENAKGLVNLVMWYVKVRSEDRIEA